MIRNGQRNIDKKWEEIFEDLSILTKLKKAPTVDISAKEIKKYAEPRLMTKFDHKNNLPDIFYANELSILPKSRGTYVIGRFDAYASFEQKVRDISIQELPFPDWIESIDFQKITSESTIMDVALISGMLDDFIAEDDGNYTQGLIATVDGRMSSGNFDFNVFNNKKSGQLIPISVSNSQMEIDGGFENTENLTLIEAKAHSSKTFLIRQLYYPFRAWEQRIKKKVLPIYLQYDNGIYNLSLFKFEDIKNYNSIKLLRRKSYVIGKTRISLEEIVSISKWAEQNYVSEPSYEQCPFPQANNLKNILSIINILNKANDKSITKEDLSLKLDFVYRQADYYSNAGKYLGIFEITKKKGIISFTKLGEIFYGKTLKDQEILLIKLVLRHKPFNIIFKDTLDSKDGKLSVSNTYETLKKEKLLTEYSCATINRRASTINNWIKQILDFDNEFY